MAASLNQTKVCLQMEISTQHHDSIKRPNGSNLRQIMEETNTVIIFPDIRDGNTPQSKRTHVTVKGCIDGVYLAKQQLISSLIVTLSFDYPETCKIDLDALNAKYGVIIACRDKKKDSKSIAIKGKEKFIDKIYEARHELLKLTTPLVKASIPPEYYSKTDLNDEFAFRQTIAIKSPLSHYQWARNFGSQFEEIQNTLSANTNTNMHNWQYRRQRMPQNHVNNNFSSPVDTTVTTVSTAATARWTHSCFNNRKMHFWIGIFCPIQVSCLTKKKHQRCWMLRIPSISSKEKLKATEQ